MKRDSNDIRDLLSARLRRVRKGPPAAHLRLVSGGKVADMGADENPPIADDDARAIASANAHSAAAAVYDLEFAARVGSLTRMDTLCANQNKHPNKA